jgi:endogenous inhibitor of DNA gyrase (YacG/DUF329 family)
MKIRCPICDKKMDSQGPKEWPDWPFCSARCKLIDLGRWLGEQYRLGSTADAPLPPDEPTYSPKPAAPSAVSDREEA